MKENRIEGIVDLLIRVLNAHYYVLSHSYTETEFFPTEPLIHCPRISVTNRINLMTVIKLTIKFISTRKLQRFFNNLINTSATHFCNNAMRVANFSNVFKQF